MAKNNEKVLLTRNLADIFYHLNNQNALQILGGCTRVKTINESSISVRSIPELTQIEKKERSIDFGPAVTLEQMLSLGKTNMPLVLYEALQTIGTFSVRNLATLGGNICAEGQKLTLWAPLLALDARLEVKKSISDSKLISFSAFSGVPQKSVLTKIKVPLSEWEVAIFRRVGPSNSITENSASFVFLADTQKDIIANIRIVYAGIIVFHSRDLENKIIGSKLPLRHNQINLWLKEAEERYDFLTSGTIAKPILKAQFLNLLRYSFERLT